MHPLFYCLTHWLTRRRAKEPVPTHLTVSGPRARAAGSSWGGCEAGRGPRCGRGLEGPLPGRGREKLKRPLTAFLFKNAIVVTQHHVSFRCTTSRFNPDAPCGVSRAEPRGRPSLCRSVPPPTRPANPRPQPSVCSLLRCVCFRPVRSFPMFKNVPCE